jgi:hypothetical protein
MPKTITVIEVDDPHFIIKLSDSLLIIDLKGSFKNDLEEAIENKPVLKETIGKVLGIFVPLHIRVNDIDSVHLDSNGKIKVSLPHHRDIVIPLEHKEDAEKLFENLNQLVSKVEAEKIQEIKARRRAEKEKIQESKVRTRAERKRYRKRPDAERRV